MGSLFSAAVFLLLLALAVGAWRLRRKRASIGPGAAGAFYELLNDDRRAAVEIIVEERTGYRDPEDRDGDLPQLGRSSGDGKPRGGVR
jgi:hypothetical protein